MFVGVLITGEDDSTTSIQCGAVSDNCQNLRTWRALIEVRNPDKHGPDSHTKGRGCPLTQPGPFQHPHFCLLALDRTECLLQSTSPMPASLSLVSHKYFLNVTSHPCYTGTTTLFSLIVLGLTAHIHAETSRLYSGYFTSAAMATAVSVLSLVSLPAM